LQLVCHGYLIVVFLSWLDVRDDNFKAEIPRTCLARRTERLRDVGEFQERFLKADI
jgi:hypothetical protein